MEKRKRRRHNRKTGFEEWGGYMEAKKHKLDEQFKSKAPDEVNWEGSESSLFKGISIFVNGYTKPGAEELKRLMMIHGGTYHSFYFPGKTTYLIASNLAYSKTKQHKYQKAVKPEWVTDCIKMGKLLPVNNYLLLRSKLSLINQRKLGFSSTVKDQNEEKSVDQMLFEFNIDENNVCQENVESNSAAGENEIINMASRDTEENSSDNSNGSTSADIFDTNVLCETASCSKELLNNRENFPFCESHESSPTFKSNICRLKSTESCNQKQLDNSLEASTSDNNPPVNYLSISSDQEALNSRNPNFLSEFYSHSRLHHIATAGIEFKQYITDLCYNHDGTFPGQEKLKKWKEMKQKKVSEGTQGHLAHPEISDFSSNAECSSFKQETSKKNSTEFLSKNPTVIHIDMDCFFVSVGLKNHPELKGQPVAVTHSKGRNPVQRPGTNVEYERSYYRKKFGPDKLGSEELDDDVDETPHSSSNSNYLKHKRQNSSDYGSFSEVASCNYEARKAGVHNGMLLGTALKLCPLLKTIPYDFEGYTFVSKTFYDTVISYTLSVEAVSCDEMFVECSDVLRNTGVAASEFVLFLREEIKEKTGCTASAGIASNKLLARLATKVAKPNGQYCLEPDDVENFIKDQAVKELPGVGRATSSQLQSIGVTKCDELQLLSLEKLKKMMGQKMGQLLFDYCRGIDNRMVTYCKERKSVSAEINYGIRFQNEKESEIFMKELATEVRRRLQKVNMKGRTITLKLKVRKEDAPLETAKFLGHGVCDSMSKSVTICTPTDDPNIIGKECISLMRIMKVNPSDMRGVGIQIGKLQNKNPSHNSGSSRHLLNFITQKSKTKTDLTHLSSKSVKDASTDRKRNTDNSIIENCSPAKVSSNVQEYGTLPNPKSSINIQCSNIDVLMKNDINKKILNNEEKDFCDSQTKVPDLCGAVNLKDIKNLITEWVEGAQEPEDDDITVFTNFIVKAVHARNLEKLDLIIKHFHRMVKNNGPLWQEVYTNVTSIMQTNILELYGSVLNVRII